jgi:hypothetical protein
VSLPYLLAIVIPAVALLILILAVVRLWQAAMRMYRIRGLAVEYAANRASMVRARLAAMSVAVREVRAGRSRTM